MIEINQLEKLSKNGSIISKLHTGEITSTEVDLSHLPDEERIKYFEWIKNLNNWASPDHSRLDSDLFYSEKQGGYYRCNFRKLQSDIELGERIEKEINEKIKEVTKVSWFKHIANLIRDNFLLSIIILVLGACGLNALSGIVPLFKALFQ